MRDRITTGVFALWWGYARANVWSINEFPPDAGTDPLVGHLETALRAVERVRGCWIGLEAGAPAPLPAVAAGLAELVATLPRRRIGLTIQQAVSALSSGSGANVQTINEANSGATDSGQWGSPPRVNAQTVDEAICGLIRVIGPAAATSDILGRLAEQLRPEGSWYSATLALRTLGPAAATPEILGRLTELLRDPSYGSTMVRQAIWAVRSLGPAAATPEILRHLAPPLWGGGHWRDVTDAVGALGPAAALALSRWLVELLRNPNRDLGGDASQALKNLGLLAVAPEVLGRLVELFHDPDSYVRRDAVLAMDTWGPPAATPQILGELAELLHDPDSGSDGVRGAAAKVLGSLGPSGGDAGDPRTTRSNYSSIPTATMTIRSSAASAVARP